MIVVVAWSGLGALCAVACSRGCGGRALHQCNLSARSARGLRMHPLPAVAWAAAGSFSDGLRNHGPKRKTDRAWAAQPLTSSPGPSARWVRAIQPSGEALFGLNVFPAGVEGSKARRTTYYPGRSPQARPI